MQFVVKRDILLKSLNFVQGVVEKKNTLPILSNVLLQLKIKNYQLLLQILILFFMMKLAMLKLLKRVVQLLPLQFYTIS